MEKIYCCKEDYDMAIDDFILENETFPLMEEDQDHVCDYCQNPSAYVLHKEQNQDMIS